MNQKPFFRNLETELIFIFKVYADFQILKY